MQEGKDQSVLVLFLILFPLCVLLGRPRVGILASTSLWPHNLAGLRGDANGSKQSKAPHTITCSSVSAGPGAIFGQCSSALPSWLTCRDGFWPCQDGMEQSEQCWPSQALPFSLWDRRASLPCLMSLCKH